MDVKSAFLNEDLKEEVYLEWSLGFVILDLESKVCKLKKALYGLKEVPCAWYQQIDAYFLQNGIRRSPSDANL